MNLFDLSPANRETHALTSTGGWVGTLPDGYTRMIDGKKFTVRTLASGIQVLVHELPDGGTVHIYDDGTVHWLDGDIEHGQPHRVDGPAVISGNVERWYYKGRKHRTDGGPAVDYGNGRKYWYVDDILHREDGPAVVLGNGEEFYYLHGKQVSKEDLP